MVEINNRTKSKINLALIKRVAERFLKLNKKQNYDVSIAFIGDAAMRKLNKTYRGKDKPTDVLAFAGEGNFLGEIIINYVQIKRQAPLDAKSYLMGQVKVYKKSVQRELIFILVHGLLHLLGYDDDTEEGGEEMEILGREFIKKIP